VQFNELNLIDPLLRAVRDEGYDTPTPIQEQTIPHLLAGRDVLGCAQTGTGKTAAFALPILQKLYGSGAAVTTPDAPQSTKTTYNGRFAKIARPSVLPTRVLILTPTRELAAQIADSFAAYGKHLPVRCTVIFGGVGQQPQVDALRRGVDILVATPGRLLDLMNQRLVRLDGVEMFVLDEADRMLDMGFIHDVKKVLAVLPSQRQNLLFSATMPAEIVELANGFLHDPVHVEVTPTATTVDKIEQFVFFVEKNDKRALLEHLLRDKLVKRAIVFTRTKHGANKLAKQLTDSRINAEAIHGNKSQTAREAALAGFKNGKVRILVATDIAARGIDVEGISHVINYDLPNIPESYVHRIGRTARAGADGIAFSFCDQEERAFLRDIERAIRKHVQVIPEHPYQSALGIPSQTDLNRVGGRAPQASSANRPRPSNSNSNRSSTSRSSTPRTTTPSASTPRTFSPDDDSPKSSAPRTRSNSANNTTANGTRSSDSNDRRPTTNTAKPANGAATSESGQNRRPARPSTNGDSASSANRAPRASTNGDSANNGSRSARPSSDSTANTNRAPRASTNGERVSNERTSNGNRSARPSANSSESRRTPARDEAYTSRPEQNGRGFRDDPTNRSGMRDFASRSTQPERTSAWNNSSDYENES